MSAPGSHARADLAGTQGELSLAVGKALRREKGGMETFPQEELHPGGGWRVKREARTFLGSSYTLVHKADGGRERARDRRRCAGGGGGKPGLSRAAAAAA